MTENTSRLSAALADRYRIEHELGQGGMATVFLAEDLKHDRKVALKVLKPELAAVLGADRFVQEIKTTASLQHPHILPLFDSGQAEGFLYYVMPYIEGETLRDKLDRETQLGIDEAVRITTEVADALDYAHRQGVIHRDIKPENILLHDGRPLVADFGIALAVSAAAGGRMTETGLSLGTPHYMSPEQATAEKDLTHKSDIYSLGTVLYEMLTGDPPHTGSSAQQIIMKIVTDTARPVTELRKSVPPNVAAAVARSLEKLPADRFGSAGEFTAALTNPGFTVPGLAETRTGAVGRAAGSRTRLWAIAAGLAVVAVAVGFALGRAGKGEPGVVRFRLTLPPGQQLVMEDLKDAPFAMSPDGSHMVYAAIDSGEATSRLYLRQLDQVDGVPVAGTEDAVAPFFSPDGLWIGFVSQASNELKKVPVTGGPAVTLADQVDRRFGGGTWGDDGWIIYTSRQFELYRVSGTGGVPEQLTDSRSALWPSVLPGGGAVLFEDCTVGCSRRNLAVLDVESGEIEVVVPGAARGWYAKSGHLVYAGEGGAIFAVPFDPGRRQVTGEPVPLLDVVSSGIAGGARLSLSRSGSMIYLPGASSDERRIVELDRSGRQVAVIGRPGRYHHPRWSPGKDRIALTVGEELDRQIWVYDVASETLSQLTFEGDNVRPTWSPDGTRIAYYSFRPGEGPDLYWKPADGSGQAERVADGEDTRNISPTFWTRDGAWIVIDGVGGTDSVASVAEGQSIYAIGTGTDRTRQTVVSASGSNQTAGAVSPNGEWIAYLSTESGQEQVYVRRFMVPGGRWLVSTDAAGAPLWAANDEIVYKDYESQQLVRARLELGAAVRVVERSPLFDFGPYLEDSNVPEFDVSRDGQRFLVLRTSRGSERQQPIVVLNWIQEIERRMAGR